MILSDLFGKDRNKKVFIILHINGRLSPESRCRNYEEPLSKVFRKVKWGTITGGGTELKENGEPLSCDIEIEVKKRHKPSLVAFLQSLEIFPVDSSITYEKEKYELGTLEGVALYLNARSENYAKYNINELVKDIDKALGDTYTIWSGWEGRKETALYFYGVDYEAMKKRLIPIIKTHPLCEKCRMEQIC